MPALLRDSQVFPIWEGTTNVLSLDVLAPLGQEQVAGRPGATSRSVPGQVRDAGLEAAAEVARRAVTHAGLWAVAAAQTGRGVAEAGARRLALTLGRGLALALLIEHAQWALDNEQDDQAPGCQASIRPLGDRPDYGYRAGGFGPAGGAVVLIMGWRAQVSLLIYPTLIPRYPPAFPRFLHIVLRARSLLVPA